MSENRRNASKPESPPCEEEMKKQIRSKCEELIDYCLQGKSRKRFFSIEKALQHHIGELACLFFQLFLLSCETKLEYRRWLEGGHYYRGDVLPRTIKTLYGEVRYWRTYLIRKGKRQGGFYPLDSELGLTADGFSPVVISMATKLATRVSFATSVVLFKSFYGWSPSTEAIQAFVLGMGRDASAYMEQVEAPADDGEVLVIEVDGKATPTAREDELQKRRGKRAKKKLACRCARHRGKHKRHCRGKRKRRKRGDKSKNGRSITLVVMYTLQRGEDGHLHGPINKKVWGSYAPRQVMLAWARRQANKRGFPPGTDKRIHIVVDGEKCLHQRLAKLFPSASFALDIRHLEEKLWHVGRTFYQEGSTELEHWVEEKRELLYSGRAAELVTELKTLKLSLSSRAKRDQSKRDALSKLINYMDPRLNMMHYQRLIEDDLPMASGIVEGAARYVIGERMDCSGMRWICERGEALLRLRCIELNGDWDRFFAWGYERWIEKMQQGEKVIVRQKTPDELPSIDALDTSSTDDNEQEEWPDVA
jgi:hypothetical protein